MTTNKPEVKRYTPAYSVDSVMRGHIFMEECERGAWVSLEDHEALQAECEKLRKDADRYRGIVAAVLREHPHRNHNRGNAPGHGHSIPGVWDEDNGALAGKECAWCKTWNEALAAMQGDKP